MMEEDVLDMLERRVGTLSEERFVRVFALLDELDGHPAALRVYDQARPRLKRVRPPRRPSLQRLFCEPFEDLLVNTRVDPRVPDGSVQRSAMRAAWAWVTQEPGFGHAAFTARLRAIPTRDNEALDALGRDIWQAGAQALRVALGRSAGRIGDAERLFGPDGAWREDIAQIARTLDMGNTIQGLKGTLPSAPIRAVDIDCAHIIRRAVIANARGDAGRAFAIISAMLARFSPPALLLDRLATLDLGLGAPERAQLMRWLSVPLASDLKARLDAAESEHGDPLARATALRDTAAALEATQSALDATNADRALRTHVAAIRAHIRRGLDETLVEARAAVERAARRDVAELTELVKAEQALLALKTCAPIAARFDRPDVFDQALAQVAGGAHEDIAELIRDLPLVAAQGVAHDARARLFRAVRVIELAASPAEADAARRAAMQALKENGL
jgi:hypothetical protein